MSHRSILKILEAQQIENKEQEEIKLRQPKFSYFLKQSGYVECMCFWKRIKNSI